EVGILVHKQGHRLTEAFLEPVRPCEIENAHCISSNRIRELEQCLTFWKPEAYDPRVYLRDDPLHTLSSLLRYLRRCLTFEDRDRCRRFRRRSFREPVKEHVGRSGDQLAAGSKEIWI